jgi:predicted ATPase
MLEQLRIQNFKGWKDTGKIRMAPITLFFGANSSGKSSIGQFLMMLKQTAESSDIKTVFYPGTKNTAVQLGSYQDMVFHRDPENVISFEYQWSLQDMLKFKDPVSEQSFSGDSLNFEADVSLGDKNQNLIQVKRLKYLLLREKTLSLSIELSKKQGKREYEVTTEKYNMVRKKMRAWALKDVNSFYGFPDEVVVYYQNAEFVQALDFEQKKLFKSICYLGPLRSKADRVYTWGGNAPESVGASGENTIAAILSARNRKISIVKPGAKRASPAKPFEEVVALKLKELGLIDSFEVQNIDGQLYRVIVRTKGSVDGVDLPDVGFGISQVLPVLVQCFYAPAGSIILMEQPEIHLHPSAQSALADVMIDIINSKENGEDRGIQLVIETHSEHFLRRLQRRIAEDAIRQEKISAYFANIAKTPATLEPLQIDIFGNIQNWPENFFGDEMGDITEQAKAAMKKRIQKAEKLETPE